MNFANLRLIMVYVKEIQVLFSKRFVSAVNCLHVHFAVAVVKLCC